MKNLLLVFVACDDVSIGRRRQGVIYRYLLLHLHHLLRLGQNTESTSAAMLLYEATFWRVRCASAVAAGK